jgi:DNA-binding IclR family transcriptional regulator
VTEPQQHAIRVIACLTLLHGRAPELGELAEVLGISKPGAVHRLHWLEKKGLCSSSGRALTQLGLMSALGLAPP